MLINDVGGGGFEEINEGVPGANYGWPEEEGPSTDPQYVSPLFAYTRNEGSMPRGRVITGGTFYDPAVPQFPAEYLDDYFFADLSGAWIWSLDAHTGEATEFAIGLHPAVDLKTAPDGSLYYLSYTHGEIRRISFAADLGAPPAILTQPAPAIVPVGQPATFTVEASGEMLTYQWQRDGV